MEFFRRLWTILGHIWKILGHISVWEWLFSLFSPLGLLVLVETQMHKAEMFWNGPEAIIYYVLLVLFLVICFCLLRLVIVNGPPKSNLQNRTDTGGIIKMGDTFNNSGNNFGHMGNINIGKAPREIDQNFIQQFEKNFPTDKKYIVVAIFGDSEAFRFAHQIKNYMEGKNYAVKGVDQAAYSEPIKGLAYKEKNHDELEIIVGSQ